MSATVRPLRSAGFGVSGADRRSTGSAVKSASDDDVTDSARLLSRARLLSLAESFPPGQWSMASRIFAAGARLGYGVRE